MSVSQHAMSERQKNGVAAVMAVLASATEHAILIHMTLDRGDIYRDIYRDAEREFSRHTYEMKRNLH